MKENTIEQVHATTRERTITICDCCGANPEGAVGDPRVFAAPVTIKSEVLTLGLAHRRVISAWDFCPSCFDQKVRPLLETIAKGRKVEETW
jgi:hypothetical protein